MRRRSKNAIPKGVVNVHHLYPSHAWCMILHAHVVYNRISRDGRSRPKFGEVPWSNPRTIRVSYPRFFAPDGLPQIPRPGFSTPDTEPLG